MIGYKNHKGFLCLTNTYNNKYILSYTFAIFADIIYRHITKYDKGVLEMKWHKYFNHFIIAPLIAAIFGNFTLGLIIAGLTGLIWGRGSGLMFISMATTILVLLTANINMEVVFLIVLTLAYMVREQYIFPYIDRKHAYTIVFIISIISYPLFRFFLGLLPAGLLNQINIAGELLLIAGLVLFIIRGKLLLENQLSVAAFLEYLLFYLCSILALMGSYIFIPLLLTGVYLINKYQKVFQKSINFNKDTFFFYNLIIILIASFAFDLLLPIGFLTGFLILSIIIFILRSIKQIPVMELVFLSMILGVVAGKMGWLI